MTSGHQDRVASESASPSRSTTRRLPSPRHRRSGPSAPLLDIVQTEGGQAQLRKFGRRTPQFPDCARSQGPATLSRFGRLPTSFQRSHGKALASGPEHQASRRVPRSLVSGSNLNTGLDPEAIQIPQSIFRSPPLRVVLARSKSAHGHPGWGRTNWIWRGAIQEAFSLLFRVIPTVKAPHMEA